jgi:hypothetical protein
VVGKKFKEKKTTGFNKIQIKSWTGKALETVNCCAFLKRRLSGAC